MFIARLTGTPAFDPSGDQLGKVRDAVGPCARPRAPRIIGLVIEVQPRRRIFVPMTRVNSIDVAGVVVSGLLNLRRFEQRPGERLVVGELLDSPVNLVEDDMTVTCSMSEWSNSAIAIGKSRRSTFSAKARNCAARVSSSSSTGTR